jgi:hypothetical protein
MEIPWETFNVENYAKIIERTAALRDVVFSDPAYIYPVPLAIPATSDDIGGDLQQAIGHVWALGEIADGVSCMRAKDRLPDHLQVAAVTEAITATYERVGKGGVCDAASPDAVAQAAAGQLLKSLRLRGGLLHFG